MESTKTQELHTVLQNVAVKLKANPAHETQNIKKENEVKQTSAAPQKRDILEERRSKPFKSEIVWFNAIGFLIMHIAMVYGLYRGLFHAKIMTTLWAAIIGYCSALSVLLGAHRCYTHKAFKATLPLRFLIVFWQTVSSQNCLWVWVRDHRQHHKYSDTNADPHNATRGFFFSHIGWLMVRKHPDVIFRGRQIDMSDLNADKLVMFQKKYYNILYFFLSIAFPMAIPYFVWNESLWDAFFITFVARTFMVLNIAWLVNSWAHMFGTRPYNKDIRPTDSVTVAALTFGEGWHNYHHTFPWDYKAAELGRNWNSTASVIEAFAKIGWAYDLKSAPASLVEKRISRCGDGTHHKLECNKILAEEKILPEEEDEGPYDDLEAVAFYEKKKLEKCNGNGSTLNELKKRTHTQRG